jgi:hypothetical protein
MVNVQLLPLASVVVEGLQHQGSIGGNMWGVLLPPVVPLLLPCCPVPCCPVHQ